MAKLTQKELGEKIYKSEISIRKYESGKLNIPPSTLYDICNILNISAETLLGSDYENYYLHNFGEVNSNSNNLTEKTLKVTEETLDVLENYKKYGDSWRDAVFRIENVPEYLLNSILNYIENTQNYYSSLLVNLSSDELPKSPEDETISYLTPEQVNDIINKVSELIKYELYKLERIKPNDN